MKKVSSRVNDKEFEAISEYANQCGETVSNVLKKAVFERAAKSKDGCPDGYRLNRRLHEGMDKEASLSKDVKTIRNVLRWDETSLAKTKSADVKESKEEPVPADKPKVTLESYTNYLRKKKEMEQLTKQIQNAVNEELKEPLDELKESIDELKARYSSQR